MKTNRRTYKNRQRFPATVDQALKIDKLLIPRTNYLDVNANQFMKRSVKKIPSISV